MRRTLVGGRILILPSLQELEELLRAPLLKQTHERALHGLHLIARDLGNLSIAVDEAARNLLELEVAGDVRVHEDLGEFSRGNDELGNEIHGVVAVTAELGGGCLVRPKLTVELQRGLIRRSTACYWRSQT